MKTKFDQIEVQRELGVAPATAERVAGLLEGRVNPDHFRSVEGPGLLEDMGVMQHMKIMHCVAWLLNAEGVGDLNYPHTFSPALPCASFVDRGDNDIPTVILVDGRFELISVDDFAERYFGEGVI